LSFVDNKENNRWYHLANHPEDPRWLWVRNMFRQVLHNLELRFDEMRPKQREFFNLARAAWVRQMGTAPLNKPLE